MSKEDFYRQARNFVSEILSELHGQGLEVPGVIDHICYRVESVKEYEDTKRQFATLGVLLIESPVNGRPISTFRLYEPITFETHSIPLVELPAPKAGKVVNSGFEHIEVVSHLSFDELEKMFAVFPADKSGLAKSLNPELEFKLSTGAIKFHPLSLDEVIEIEKKLQS